MSTPEAQPAAERTTTAAADPPTLGDAPLQTMTLQEVAVAAVNYHAWLTDLARPHLGDHPIEFGSGLGDYAQAWLDTGIPAMTVGDLEASRLELLRSRFAPDHRVEVIPLDVLDPPEREHSALVSFNVLEHIPDHVGALASAHRLLRPGGKVITFVPAFQFALGAFDRRVGHLRRYTTKSLAETYRQAGLELEEIRYVNAPGLFAWFGAVRVLRMTPGDGRLLRVWDRFVVPVARRLEGWRKPPFGQSVYAVGRVPAARGEETGE